MHYILIHIIGDSFLLLSFCGYKTMAPVTSIWISYLYIFSVMVLITNTLVFSMSNAADA